MQYGDLENAIVGTVPIGQIAALDIEIHPCVRKPEEILSPSRQIIGIGVMYFTAKEPTLLVAEGEGAQHELEILKGFNDFIRRERPLLVVGYGISAFDRPFLTLKMKTQYRDEKLWAINDMLERAYFLGVDHEIRFYLYKKGFTEKPRFMSLEAALKSPAFKGLPLRREEKRLAPRGEDFIEKGEMITKLWKENRAQFRAYLASDVYNCAILSKFLYQIGTG